MYKASYRVGDFYLKHEPTLDVIGYSNSGAILDMEGLYVTG
jgi:hypothetical protein